MFHLQYCNCILHNRHQIHIRRHNHVGHISVNKNFTRLWKMLQYQQMHHTLVWVSWSGGTRLSLQPCKGVIQIIAWHTNKQILGLLPLDKLFKELWVLCKLFLHPFSISIKQFVIQGCRIGGNGTVGMRMRMRGSHGIVCAVFCCGRQVLFGYFLQLHCCYLLCKKLLRLVANNF